ncbi:MAG: type II toxin-antitoxin system HicB family antitoxin, partial [Chloroflexi bacterium]|nr:type II toxin-antitoxin system HicB family antitoxin [Chloroflexota bacterium]
MTRVDVYLNIGRDTVEAGGPLAHLPALVGCVARGPDEEQALIGLRHAVEEYVELQRIDLNPRQIEFEVHKVEKNVFPWDFEPLGAQEIETYFHRMEISRHALLDLVGNLPDQALDWQPDESTWPIRRVLEHVSDAEWWYLSRLKQWPTDPFQRLDAVHRFVVDTLRGWNSQDLRRTFRWGRHREWSARKVLRVLLENEETERQAIERLLAWKIAGREPGPSVPEVKTDTLEGDLEPLASGDRDEWHRRKQASRTQLLALVKGSPEEILDFQPAAGERSTRQLLQQLADD